MRLNGDGNLVMVRLTVGGDLVTVILTSGWNSIKVMVMWVRFKGDDHFVMVRHPGGDKVFFW